MKKWLVILGLLSVSAALFIVLRPFAAYVNYPPASGREWIAFGDSLTSGIGAGEGGDYPTQLGKRLGVSILNLGTPGASTHDGVAHLDEVLKHDPRVVLLCFGGNDTLQGVPHAQTFGNLARMIDEFHQAGAFVVLLGIRTASVRDKYKSEFKQLAKSKRVLYVPNILDGVLGDPRLMADYVHPNEQGYAAIADRLETALSPLLPHLVAAP